MMTVFINMRDKADILHLASREFKARRLFSSPESHILDVLAWSIVNCQNIKNFKYELKNMTNSKTV